MPVPASMQHDAAVVVGLGDEARHVALRRAVLVACVERGDGAAAAEVSGHGVEVERRVLHLARRLDHHVQPGRLVVDDGEADAVVVHPRGDGEVGL